MSELTVALLQMESAGFDQDANAEKGEHFCREAAGRGADIALFPEMWNIGYRPWRDGVRDGSFRSLSDDEAEQALRERWAERAVPLDGAFVGRFRELASELGMAVGVTFLEEVLENTLGDGSDRAPALPRNTLAIFDRRGELALRYSKVHTCDFGMDIATAPGDAFPVCELPTSVGPVMVGAMICFDREFPEPARLLMLAGAEIILVPNACEMEQNRTGQLRARAFENMVGVALANYAGPEEKGRSVAFSPVAFDQDGRSLDTTIVEGGEGEEVVLARFDLDALRHYRKREVWGDAYRRPGLYGRLATDEQRPPFFRDDARR
ncbi:MAG: carbon-nitrogen hydrolase family protein [Candidatus Eisenbacteria bacterium]|nr:carbon-nitrogen hydrolase family protein [Candidatus Eisenbacteria bacterium]